MGMRYMICQQATNRFRPSELTKHYPRCSLTALKILVKILIKRKRRRVKANSTSEMIN